MLSKVTYFLCLILILYASFCFYPRWKQPATEATIAWDVSGYYWYLPSIFIYKDLKHQSFKDSILSKYQPTNTDFQQAFLYKNGNYVMKYSSGMAFLYLPGFLIAHALAQQLGYPADGFSAPYQLAIQLSGLLFALIGLWYFRKLLKFFYDDNIVSVTLLILVIGTNYLNYAAIDVGMSHSWLFTLYVFLILNTHYYYQTFKNKYAYRIGLLVGLVTLIRPTEIVSCIIPLLWGLEQLNIAAIKERISLLVKRYKSVFIAAACGAVVISIQLIYWKYVSGHWVVYSYQDQGFTWLPPHVKSYIFSYKSGWLTYCPMMLLAFIGLIPFIKSGRNKIAIITFFFINLYIVCAWDIWWFGGRAMVQSYAILMFPVAALTNSMFKKKLWMWVWIPIILFFTYYNIWITYNYHTGAIYDTDCTNKAYYWSTMLTWHAPSENTIKLKDDEEQFKGTPKHLKLIYENDFEQDTSVHNLLPAIEGKKSDVVDSSYTYSSEYSVAFNKGEGKWVRAQATFRSPNKEWNVWKMAQFNIEFKYKGQKIKGQSIKVFRFLNPGQTKDIYLDARVPDVSVDTVAVFLWNGGSNIPVQFDNIKIWSFDE